MFNGHENESLLMWKAEKSSLLLFSHVQITALTPDSDSLRSPSLPLPFKGCWTHKVGRRHNPRISAEHLGSRRQSVIMQLMSTGCRRRQPHWAGENTHVWIKRCIFLRHNNPCYSPVNRVKYDRHVLHSSVLSEVWHSVLQLLWCRRPVKTPTALKNGTTRFKRTTNKEGKAKCVWEHTVWVAEFSWLIGVEGLPEL